MSNLTQKSCVPCKSGSTPLTTSVVREMSQDIHADWQISENSKLISRVFSFKNYYQTIAFVNSLAWIAHQEDHHPDLEVSYNCCTVKYSTHSINGLSENDFICAAKLDALLP